MKSILLLVKDDVEPQRAHRRRLLRQNVERHAMPTQIGFVGDSSINHALIAVAQEVAELLHQAAPAQANSINYNQTTVRLKNEEL